MRSALKSRNIRPGQYFRHLQQAPYIPVLLQGWVHRGAPGYYYYYCYYDNYDNNNNYYYYYYYILLVLLVLWHLSFNRWSRLIGLCFLVYRGMHLDM